jgi:glycerophosphoryl diester phosphodiesterase
MELEIKTKTWPWTFPYVSSLLTGSIRLLTLSAKWAQATTYHGGQRLLPQAIAHRGFKAEHPENTMDSFKGAVEVGAHAIETDIHMSKDGVVVLSHVSYYRAPSDVILI